MRTTADIYRLNAFAVVRAIHAAGVRTRRELVEDTGLSFTTVATICTRLMEHGVMVESGRERAMVGRPTARLALNPDHGVFLGVDIAETYVHVETFDAALESVSSTRRSIDPHQKSPAAVIARVQEAIVAERALHPALRCLGVGVATPGQVNRDGGVSVFAPNWGWRDVPLRDLLSASVDGPLTLDNPLKSLVISEIWSNPELAGQDFAVINLGTGVGASFAIDGRVHRGHTNSAGEWGHTVLMGDGRPCRCGSRGCVEAYIGAPGILQTLQETHPGSPLLHGDDQTATVVALQQAAEQQDAVALDVIERVARSFGMATASIINFLNPSRIVVTGWVSDHIGGFLLELARPHLAFHALQVPLEATMLTRQPTGNAVCLGSAAQAFERYLDALSDPPQEALTPPARAHG